MFKMVWYAYIRLNIIIFCFALFTLGRMQSRLQINSSYVCECMKYLQSNKNAIILSTKNFSLFFQSFY